MCVCFASLLPTCRQHACVLHVSKLQLAYEHSEDRDAEVCHIFVVCMCEFCNRAAYEEGVDSGTMCAAYM